MAGINRRTQILGVPPEPESGGTESFVEGEVLDGHGDASVVVSTALVPAHPAHSVTPQVLREAFADFIRSDIAHGDATDATIYSYIHAMEVWLKWCASFRLNPATATRNDIVTYRRWMKEKGLSAQTRSHRLSIVRRFYDAAINRGFLEVNPAAGVPGGKDLTASEEKFHVWSEKQLEHLLTVIPSNTLQGKRGRCIVGLMLIHGLRRVELYRLVHEQLDLDGLRPSMKVLGKGRKIRSIYLRDDTRLALKLYIEAKRESGQPCQNEVFRVSGRRGYGNPLKLRAINYIVDGYLEMAGIKVEGASCHALRHSHATHALANGAELHHIKDELGHATLDQALAYSRIVGRFMNNPARYIDPELQFDELELIDTGSPQVDHVGRSGAEDGDF